MKKNHILVISIMLFVSGFCSAATPVNIDDFVGTTWGVYGKNKISASKVGTETVAGIGTVNFSGDGTSFSVMDSADYIINGTYGVDSGKLVVNVGVDDVQDFYDNYVQQALDDSGLSDYIDDWAVDVTSAKSTCKVTYSGSVVSLAITISSKARLTLDYEDAKGNPKTFHGKVSFSLSMSGDHPVAGGSSNWASNWDITAKASLNAKKVKVTMPVSLELSLGDADPLDQYTFVDTDGLLFPSDMQHDFCRQKNKIIFGSDDSDGGEMASIITNFITSNSSVSPDNVEITSGSVTGTIKNGTTNKIAIKGTIKFKMYVYDENKEEDIATKGTLTLTGSGVPAP